MQIQRRPRPPAIEFGFYLINVFNSKFARQANSCSAPPRIRSILNVNGFLAPMPIEKCKRSTNGICRKLCDLNTAPVLIREEFLLNREKSGL